MPDTRLGGEATLVPCSPDSESLLSSYAQTFGGKGAQNDPFPPKWPLSPRRKPLQVGEISVPA